MYAGIDPVSKRSKKKYYLVETVPAGPKAAKEAERSGRGYSTRVDEKRNPQTVPQVNELMDRYLELINLSR